VHDGNRQTQISPFYSRRWSNTKSIVGMRQATNIKNFVPTMLLPALAINTGPKDYAPIKQVQLTRFESDRWVPLGDPVNGN
jgi:hypothetical protein